MIFLGMSQKLIERRKIVDVLTSFYERVKNNDVLSPSFHILVFDFDNHVENIADFWDLTLNSKKRMENPDNSKFTIVDTHKFWSVDEVELEEWLGLFKLTLDEHAAKDPSFQKAIDRWWQVTLSLKKFFLLRII